MSHECRRRCTAIHHRRRRLTALECWMRRTFVCAAGRSALDLLLLWCVYRMCAFACEAASLCEHACLCVCVFTQLNDSENNYSVCVFLCLCVCVVQCASDGNTLWHVVKDAVVAAAVASAPRRRCDAASLASCYPAKCTLPRTRPDCIVNDACIQHSGCAGAHASVLHRQVLCHKWIRLPSWGSFPFERPGLIGSRAEQRSL